MNYNTLDMRSARKNSFPQPNELFSLGLSPGEISVYMYLVRYANRETQQCYPSYRTIGRMVKMSQNTVRKYVQQLVERGLITTEPTTIRTQDGRGRNGTLRYTLLPIAEVMEQYHQQQMEELELSAAKQRAAEALAEYDRTHPREPLCGPENTGVDLPPTGQPQRGSDGPLADF